jgi:ABC-type branched-subunit amino acid transport system substrate-binding protein
LKRTTRLLAILLLVPLALSGCGRANSSANQRYPIGSIWAAPALEGVVTWQTASGMVTEQHDGFAAGMKAVTTIRQDSVESAEGNQADDVQVAIRTMVETDQDIAVIGATTNEATVRAASLVNFFNVPMIVPAAYGDDLLPSTNLWAFRLSAPGSAYAAYFFNSLLPVVAPAAASGDGTTPTPSPATGGLTLAILYEENTFGESAAVAAATAAMKQNLDIGFYGHFAPGAPDVDALTAQIESMKAENVRLIYLISGDPDAALTVVKTIRSAYTSEQMPVLVGQAGGFATEAFKSSADANGVYVLRQKLDKTNCPAGIDSISQGQEYAAVYLLDQAIIRVEEELQPAQTNLSLTTLLSSVKGASTQTPISTLREKVRDMLKTMNLNVPCLGPVAFDNSGQNKQLQFEIVAIKDGQAVESSANDLNGNLPALPTPTMMPTEPTETPTAPAPNG